MISGHTELSKWLRLSEVEKQIFLRSLFEDIKNHMYEGRFERALDKCGISHTEEMVRKMVEVYRKHKPNIHLYPDAAEFLEKLSSAGHPVYIVTNGFVETQKNKIKALGLQQYKYAITSEFQEKIHKNDSRFSEYITKKLELEGDILLFGDNPIDDGGLCKNLKGKFIRAVAPFSKYYTERDYVTPKLKYNPKKDYSSVEFIRSVNRLMGD